MTCKNVQRKTVDFVDGRLRGADLAKLKAHLTSCAECELHVGEVRLVRSNLQSLPRTEVPDDLRVRLRVRASQERLVQLETNGSHWLRLWNNWKFRLNQMMRPVTIPATGGFFSSVALFAAFALTISTTTRVVPFDVPVYDLDRANANLLPMQLNDSVVVTLSTDGIGRVTDYAVREGTKSVMGDTSRPQFNNISLPSIPSVMTIAHPVSSDIRISFNPLVFRQ